MAFKIPTTKNNPGRLQGCHRLTFRRRYGLHFKGGVSIVDLLTITIHCDAPPCIPLRGGAGVGLGRCDWSEGIKVFTGWRDGVRGNETPGSGPSLRSTRLPALSQPDKSALAEHHLETGHKIDFDGAKSLATDGGGENFGRRSRSRRSRTHSTRTQVSL